MLEFRLLLGLHIVTVGKNTFNWAYKMSTSFPRKILATKFPPCLSTCVVILSAASNSCPWMYSSISCSPVTSGAPSQITKSATSPSKWLIIWWAVDIYRNITIQRNNSSNTKPGSWLNGILIKLYCKVEYEKAFDSIHCDEFWKIMEITWRRTVVKEQEEMGFVPWDAATVVDRMEKAHFWPYSPQGEKELSSNTWLLNTVKALWADTLVSGQLYLWLPEKTLFEL